MRITSTLAVLASTVAMALAQSKESNCTSWAWDGQAAYLRDDASIERVSAAQTCPSRSNSSLACPIDVQGDLETVFRANISTGLLQDHYYQGKSGATSYYYNLVNITIPSANTSSTGVSFPFYLIATVNTIQEQQPGTSGYLQFRRTLQCYVGTLSGCRSGTVPDGTPVEFCAGLYHTTGDSDAFPILDGTYNYAEVNTSDVGMYKNPFAGLSRGAASSVEVNLIWMGMATVALVVASLA